MDEFNIIVENEEPIDVTTDIQNDFLKGDKGPKGDPNTLTIGTVQKGEEADASIEGESPNQILNLILPKGDKGDKPEKGIDYFTTEEKQEIVQEVVEEVNAFNIKIVEELPTEDIRTKVIYFVPKEDEEEQNVYDEYIYIENKWEHIGSTKVDLTEYYKKKEIDEVVSNLEEEINTLKQSSVKTYTSKGLNFRFERYGNIVEVVITGQITETVTKDEANDITIDTAFIPSVQKAEMVSLQDSSLKPLFTLIAMTNGTFRWRSNTTMSSGWCTGSFIYLV